MGCLLLVERGHAEWLMHWDVLATGRSVPVMCVISETALVQIAQVRHDSVDTTKESLVFLNDKELVTAATESSDGLTQVLWQDLQRPIRFLSADEDLAN